MKRWKIIDALAKKVQANQYLEIGVRDGENFSNLTHPFKKMVSVDPVPGMYTTHTMTSDGFFELHKRFSWDFKPDIAFIDGLHTDDQVARDFANILRINPECVIVVHDCLPGNEEGRAVSALN